MPGQICFLCEKFQVLEQPTEGEERGSLQHSGEKKEANFVTKVGLPQSISTGVCCLRFWSKRKLRTRIFLLKSFGLVKNGKAREEGEGVCEEESPVRAQKKTQNECFVQEESL
ncbi:hypothetical protein TorRG33x02_335260 [Trema orientale]|uniref:Uncharacterized protein n=1 Tax=Trema orientale TaxID=63057 RepID=A0A2P5B1N1_TREOI|nr:hypothetical protein TorRG33x02_335260 [Trema orientale]